MNNSVIKNLLIAVAMLIVLPCIAYAIPPHDTSGGYNYTCNNCHTTHKTLGTIGYNNICLNCHRPGRVDPQDGQIIPFIYKDMANAQGPSSGKLYPAQTQSSHNWEASDDNPRAGAQPPTNPIMNGSAGTGYNFLGNLYCARCHSIHSISQTPTSNVAPFIRATNDQDQMCLDCHKPRNVTSHVYGSHPVNVDYATVAAQHPNEYNSTPVNSNPANPTSAMRIVQGKVLCSTCHGIHFADSNSRTFDNMTSAKFNGLSSSRGYLLRTDLYGKTVTDSNICTNCHRTTDENGIPNSNPNALVKNHNGKKNQNIQCADCHGGHVDEADGTIPNVFLIKRYMNVSSSTGAYPAIRNAKVMFQYTSGTAKNYNTNSFGVCVACHSTLPGTIPQHSVTNDARVCNSCHIHKSGFSPDCNACHGFPPAANHAGAPDGYADGYQNLAGHLDESTSAHKSHAGGGSYYGFSCYECHNGNTHNMPPTPTFQDVFKQPGTIAGAGVYDPNTRQCSNVYCHSDGAPRGSVITYKPITWADGANGLNSIIGTPGECNACHSATPATNAHTMHLSYNYGCVICHAKTVSSNTTLLASAKATGGAHVNGTKDLLFSGTIGGNPIQANFSSSSAKCSSVYCHSNGRGVYSQPVWTSPTSGACGTCHTTTTISTGAHQPHLAAGYGPILNTDAPPTSCNACHNYPTQHVDGTIQSPPTTNCTASCHKQGAPTWITGRIACETCHTAPLSVIYGITAPDKSLEATAGHNKPTGANKQCTDCHDNTSAHINRDPSVHTNRLAANLTGPLNTECTYCHNNLANINNKPQFLNMSTHFKTKGGGQTMECYQCHELHGTTNLSMIRSTISFINSTSWSVAFTNTSTGMINPTTNRGLCQVCHTQTQFYRAGRPEANHPTKGCFNCHPHNGAGGAFKPSGSCDACHGYPPVPKSAIRGPYDPNNYKGTFGTYNNYTNARFEDYSGGGGAHLNHVPTYAKATEGWTNCAICHNGGNTSNAPQHKMVLPLKQHISNVTINVDPKVNFNNSLQIIYSGARLVDPPQVNSTGSCINVGCHFQPTPRWSKER